MDVLPGRDGYLPYIYGQKFDDFRLFRKPSVHSPCPEQVRRCAKSAAQWQDRARHRAGSCRMMRV